MQIRARARCKLDWHRVERWLLWTCLNLHQSATAKDFPASLPRSYTKPICNPHHLITWSLECVTRVVVNGHDSLAAMKRSMPSLFQSTMHDLGKSAKPSSSSKVPTETSPIFHFPTQRVRKIIAFKCYNRVQLGRYFPMKRGDAKLKPVVAVDGDLFEKEVWLYKRLWI